MVDGDSNAALAVLAALGLAIYKQRRTGRGEFMRTSMIAGNALCYSDDFCTYAGKPPIALCDDEYFGTSALDRVYQAAGDTWVCLAVRNETELANLATVVGLPDLTVDERFADAKARAANDAALASALAAAFAARPALEWEALSAAARVGCVAVSMGGHSVFTSFDPGLREAGLTIAYDHPLFGEMVRAAPPLTFSETPSKVAPPCVRGQHNRAILSEVGYSDEEISRFESDLVVIPPA